MNYARWATENEILNKLTKVSYDSKIEKSGVQIMYDDNNLYVKADEAHTMVIGGAGSGKTETTLLPSLRLAIRAEESFIVNDVKGELFDKLSGELKKQGYNTIVIDLINQTKGNKFNPLSLPYKLYKDGKKDKAIDLIENIAYYFCCNETTQVNSDPFWTNSAMSLFTGLALYLFENAQEDEININSIDRLTSEFDKITEYVNSLNKSSLLYITLSSITLAPPETKASIISVFKQNIKMFATRELLSKLMSETDFDIANVQKDKTAIFIISNNNTYSRRLIPIVVNTCYQASTLTNDKSRLLNIFLDDFENLIPINDFVNILTLSRSQNIRFNIYIKSFLELKKVYGVEIAEMLKFEFGTLIYLLANDIETLEQISRMCGDKKVGDNFEPLISVEELKVLNEYEAIVLIPRILPIKTKLLPDYKIDWKFDNNKIEIPNINIKDIKVFDI